MSPRDIFSALPLENQLHNWETLKTFPAWIIFMEKIESMKRSTLGELVRSSDSHSLAVASGRLQVLTECSEFVERQIRATEGEIFAQKVRPITGQKGK